MNVARNHESSRRTASTKIAWYVALRMLTWILICIAVCLVSGLIVGNRNRKARL